MSLLSLNPGVRKISIIEISKFFPTFNQEICFLLIILDVKIHAKYIVPLNSRIINFYQAIYGG